MYVNTEANLQNYCKYEPNNLKIIIEFFVLIIFKTALQSFSSI